MRDTEIVASIVAGDPNGLAMAYDKYADSLFKYCRSLLPDPADAGDAVQDTFVIVASRLDALREPERFRAWLYTVARNESFRILRSKKGTLALDEAPDVTDDGADVNEHAHRAELRSLFENATAGLNPGEREVIELQLRQGLEAGEVAAVLGVSRNHAHTLLSRARSQLEACLSVLLVARAEAGAGRGECGELGAMLDGWDGRLTVLLRKRVHRHIEHCAACSARRAFELRPAMLLDLSPGAALAAGAAESLRRAFSAPPGLKAHTIALATGHGPEGVAHSTAVLGRAGAFGRHGFPRPAHGSTWDHGAWHHGAWHHGTAGGVKALRSSPRGQAAAAGAVVVAVAVAATAFALTGRDQHFTPSANPKPPGAAPHAPSSAAPVTQSAATKRPSARPPAAKTPVAKTPAGSQSPAPTHTASLTPAPPAPAPTNSTPPRPAPTTASPAPTAGTPRPTPTPTTPTRTRSSSPPPPPSPTPPGTLSVLPDGGTVIVVPGATGSVVTLQASGGTVTWSVSVANDPNHVVSVSPADSGTLTPAHPATTLIIRTSQFVPCGLGTTTPCPALTISPGDATFAVWTGWTLPLSAKTASATTEPVTTGPVTTGPATTGPATTGPATTGPATTGPATTGPATTGPVGIPPAVPTRRITIRS